jgi:hypothetical protein
VFSSTGVIRSYKTFHSSCLAESKSAYLLMSILFMHSIEAFLVSIPEAFISAFIYCYFAQKINLSFKCPTGICWQGSITLKQFGNPRIDWGVMLLMNNCVSSEPLSSSPRYHNSPFFSSSFPSSSPDMYLSSGLHTFGIPLLVKRPWLMSTEFWNRRYCFYHVEM